MRLTLHLDNRRTQGDMSNNILQLSKLRCEPNRIDPAQLPSYYGPQEGYTFWRVFVDDKLLSDMAQPFTAYDPVIELSGNSEVPIWGDGWGFVSVRQIGSYVIWCRPIAESLDDFLLDAGLPDGKFIIFDVADYTEALHSLVVPDGFIYNNAERKRRCSYNLYYPLSANPAVCLPRLSSSELRSLLWHELPSDDLPIYRIPEKSDDPRGVKLLQRLKAALQVDDTSLSAPPPPSRWLDVEIGLDLAQAAECL